VISETRCGTKVNIYIFILKQPWHRWSRFSSFPVGITGISVLFSSSVMHRGISIDKAKQTLLQLRMAKHIFTFSQPITQIIMLQWACSRGMLDVHRGTQQGVLMVRGKLNVWNTITMIAMFCVRRMAII
jgi:hypothetical protein